MPSLVDLFLVSALYDSFPLADTAMVTWTDFSSLKFPLDNNLSTLIFGLANFKKLLALVDLRVAGGADAERFFQTRRRNAILRMQIRFERSFSMLSAREQKITGSIAAHFVSCGVVL